jgi:hypothetical protein
VAAPATSNPPRDYFSVWQRLFRGYGPVAALAVLLLLMSLLVPSNVPKNKTAATNVPAGDTGSSDVGAGTTPTGDTTGSTVAGGPTAGATTQQGQSKTGVVPGTAAGKVEKCPADRPLQVPGDPYSPPCVAFSGSNGGATSKGVTATEIHVAYRSLNEKGFQQTLAELAGASLSDTPDDIKRTINVLAQYFNSRFQFYGRKLVIDFYDGQGSNTNELLGKGQDKAEQDATKVADEIKAFADLSATSEPYANALARRGVLGFGDPYLSRQWHDDHRPYIWSIATDGTKVANFAAEYSTKRLCGKPASLAGGSLKGQPRKFASLAPENSWYQESVQVARSTFTAAKCDPGVNIKYQLDLGTMSNQASNMVAQLQSQGVTTILCGCDPILPVFLSGAAARQGYYPEFVIVGTALTDTDIVGQLWNQDFASHAFGVSSLTEPVPANQTIGYAAYKAIAKDEPAFSVDLIYYQMAEMAIGIQMAGPNLTPQTFEQGMFAYPPRVGPAGLWGFGPHDYTAADDVREIYYDPNATSKYNQKKGAFVEAEPGKRYREGQITGGDPKVPAH